MQALPLASLAPSSESLALPGNPLSSKFLGIDDAGDVVASGVDRAGTAAYVARSPRGPAKFEKESVPGSTATTVSAINDGGMIVGFYTDRGGKIDAFAERNGAWTRYFGPPASKTTEYLGVNDSGTVVGFYTDRSGVKHAFARDAKSGRRLDIRPEGRVSSVACAINDGGDIVGYLTRPRGRARAFLSRAGSITELSYPGATETKALGIGKDGRIVGSYEDASGATHGFILRDASTTPRWKSFDEPNARGLTVLTGINSRGDVVGYYADGDSQVRGLFLRVENGSQAPLVIPVVGYGGDPGDTDPGAVPDQHLFAAIIDNAENSSSSLAKNCPGVTSSSTCQPYKYVDFLYMACNTTVTLAAYQWANANDETAFQHVYPNGTSSSNRILYNATPNPNCMPNSHNAYMRMNAGDLAYNLYLYQHVWAGANYQKDFPAPYGALEDQGSTFAGIVVGGSSQVSTEYGRGVKPSGFANQVGNSNYHNVTDWETALGIFVNGACAVKCVDMALNGVATGYGNVAPCNVVSNGHCHSQYQSGLIDNQAAIDNTCKTVTGGNLKYFMAERPIFAGRFGFEFLNSQTMTVDINTAANLYSHTSDACAKTNIIDLEPSYGEGGLGDVTGGHRVRLTTLAYRWLVPNPTTGMPDRVVSQMFTEGGTSGEVPYFFEDTLVPYGAETTVGKYVWNGSVQTTGGGCPSASGDHGGAISLLARCVGSAGIYCQQYQHLYINGADFGTVAACLNTSTTSEPIVSSWFKHDPMSSYKYELALAGGEMTSVPYQGVSGGSIALSSCTNKTYCTGSKWLSAQTTPFKGDGTDQLCGPCGVILLQKQ